MSDLLDGLNPSQREAVSHIDGPMLVVAGAGSGKTRVVTRRIAYMISHGVPDYHILALTFTNKAAGEMVERVSQMTGQCRALVSTFHSACARFLRFDVERFRCGRTRDFSIYDSDDQTALFKQCLNETNLDDKRWTPRACLSDISRYKSDMQTPDDAEASAQGFRQQKLVELYRLYEEKLRASNAFDFDDLLWYVQRMLSATPDLLEEYQRRYRYILVDEYQDTNRIQYALLKLLAGNNRNIMATGDPDQSIYSWRGADYRNIMDFKTDFPGAKIVALEQNYRCTKTVCEVANALIAHNENRIEKRLLTDNPDGEPVTLVTASDDRMEAAFIANEVQTLLRDGAKSGDISIFYRVNAHSRMLEEVFMRENLPYTIVGGIRFYDRKEVRDLLGYLKVINNPRDGIAFRRMINTPPRGVGDKTLDAIDQQAIAQGLGLFEFFIMPDFLDRFEGRATAKLKAAHIMCRELGTLPRSPVRAIMEQVLKSSGLKEHYRATDPAKGDERAENIESLINRAAEFDELHPDRDLAAFLEEIALVADVDGWDDSQDRVSMMTVHAAKGLEFPYVFVAGLEDGLLPHQNSKKDGDYDAAALEEERRLFYVAITRTKKRLYLTNAMQRFQWGSVTTFPPSPFLDELPQALLTLMRFDGSSRLGPAHLMPPMQPTSGFGAPFPAGKRRFAGFGQPRRRVFDEDTSEVDPFADDDDVCDSPFIDDSEDVIDINTQTRQPLQGGKAPLRSAFQNPLSARKERRDPLAPILAQPANAAPRFAAQTTSGAAQSAGNTSETFRTGERVTHQQFGTGRVLATSGKRITVHFTTCGTKTLHIDMAHLRRG